MILKKEKYKLLKLYVILYLVLSICFYHIINNLWIFRRVESTTDINFQNISAIKYILGSTVILCNILVLNTIKLKDFIYSILSLVLVVFLMPSAIIFSVEYPIDWRIFVFHNILFYSILLISRIKIDLKLIELSSKRSFLLLTFLIVIGIAPFLRYLLYVNIENLWLENVYETRLIFGKIGDKYYGYTYGWFSRFLIPAMLVFAIYFKNRKIVILSLILLIYLYLLGAHKSVIYGSLFVVILYRFSYLITIKFILKSLIGLSVLCFILSYFYSNNYLTIFTIRRALFLPGLLDVAYFDFFDQNHLYWSESFMKSFIEYPYDKSHAFMIADTYFLKPDMGSNNGIISDGFMNAGALGVLINVLVISLFFSIINQLNISSKFFGLFIFLFVSLISSSLTTTLLTHGGLILFFVVMFFLKNTENSLKTM